MAEPDKKPVTLEELLVSNLAQTDALAKLLIEKGLITRGLASFLGAVFLSALVVWRVAPKWLS